MRWPTLRQPVPTSWKIIFRRLRARLVDPRDHGLFVTISGQTVRVPAYFKGGGRADYENIAVANFVAWLDLHPPTQIIDRGCSLSTYGLTALTRSDTAKVVGIDPDRVSLKCTRALCAKPLGPDRLRLVQGFPEPDHREVPSPSTAAPSIHQALADPAVPVFIEEIRYRESTSPTFRSIPRLATDHEEHGGCEPT